MAELDPSLGDVVELSGLASRPELNGTFAVVIEPDSNKEAEQLVAASRVKVTSYPNTLSIKSQNLRVLSNAEVALIDWSFMDGNFLGMPERATVCAIISHPTYFLGGLFECGNFAEQLWTLISRGVPMPSKRYLNDSDRRSILNNTAAHYLYLLSMDRIAHQLVIETRAGAARLYQCYVDCNGDENGDRFGFTAREWLTGVPDDPDDALSPDMLTTRQRWGGTDPMNRKKLAELLDLVSTLEKHAKTIAFIMVFEVMEGSQEPICKQTLSIPEDRLYSWTKELMDQPGCVTVTLAEEMGQETVISSTALYKGHPFSFSIPGADACGSSVVSFVQSYQELIGYEPDAHVFIAMLHYSDCNRVPHVDPLPGHNAKGWGLCALSVPH